MSYQEEIQAKLQAATKAGRTAERDALRLLLSALSHEEVAQGRAELDEAAFQAVVRREIKKRREAIEAFQKAGRPERVAEEEAQLHVLEAFLPRQLDEAEIEAVVREVLENFSGPLSLGPVMGACMARLKGRADGARVRAVVTRLLQVD